MGTDCYSQAVALGTVSLLALDLLPQKIFVCGSVAHGSAAERDSLGMTMSMRSWMETELVQWLTLRCSSIEENELDYCCCGLGFGGM